jgi:hypothetical protein
MHYHLEHFDTSLMVPSDFALLAYCSNILGYKKTKTGNSVETFFLAIVRAKKRNFTIIKKNKQATPLFGKKMVGAFHDFNLRCVFQFKKEKKCFNTVAIILKCKS